MDKLLEGKTALVTGASRGLGRAIAQRMAASGALVCINYASNHDAAHHTLGTIEDAGGTAFLLQEPLGPDGSAEALTAELKRRTGSDALDMFTLVMAKELGPPKIAVNSVLPGFNATESNHRELDDPATRQAIEDMTLLGRFGQPEDIANVVHALATPAMGWATGQCIEASGGFKLC